MERPRSVGTGGGENRSPTELFSSDDELVGNPSGNRSPIGPERFLQALQGMESHSQYVLANATAAAGSGDRESPNSKRQGAKEQIDLRHP